MPDNPTSFNEALPEQKDDLRQTLDRIASALEKRNEQADKKEGGDEKKEDGDKDKKEGEDKGKEGEGGKDPQQKKPGKLKRFFTSFLGIVITLIVLTILIIAGLALLHYEKTHESTDDAYTTGHVHQVSPRVSGLVTEVWVDDNLHVKKNDLLVKLDTRDYEVALQRNQANLDQAKAQVLQAQAAVVQANAGVEQAQAQVAQARAQTSQAGAQYQVAGVNYGRNSALFTKDTRAVAQADVDTTKSNFDASKGAFDAAKANVQAAEANVDAAKSIKQSRDAELVVAQANVEAAEASVEDATLQLSYCWVLAPCDGRVSRKTVETGFRLSAGQSVLAVTEDVVWVLANYKETQLEHVRVGQRVTIPIDMFKDHPFTGHVDSVQNGSGATYSLLPPDNATGNFTKIVQRVPVKIVFDNDNRSTSIKGFEDLVATDTRTGRLNGLLSAGAGVAGALDTGSRATPTRSACNRSIRASPCSRASGDQSSATSSSVSQAPCASRTSAWRSRSASGKRPAKSGDHAPGRAVSCPAPAAPPGAAPGSTFNSRIAASITKTGTRISTPNDPADRTRRAIRIRTPLPARYRLPRISSFRRLFSGTAISSRIGPIEV